MNWLIYGILAVLAFGLYNFFIKISSDKINIPLAVGILGLSVAVIGFLVFGYFKLSGQEILYTSEGLKFVILAGVFTAIAEFFYYLMFLRGAQLAIGLPLVVGGTVIVGTVLGIIFLKETLPVTKIVGLITTIIGIVILSK